MNKKINIVIFIITKLIRRFNVFTVRITFLDSIDEYGYVFRDYTFEDVNDARAFYAMKKNEYKDDGLVSVSSDC